MSGGGSGGLCSIIGSGCIYVGGVVKVHMYMGLIVILCSIL